MLKNQYIPSEPLRHCEGPRYKCLRKQNLFKNGKIFDTDVREETLLAMLTMLTALNIGVREETHGYVQESGQTLQISLDILKCLDIDLRNCKLPLEMSKDPYILTPKFP